MNPKACEEHALDESRLGDIFEVWWPRLKARLDDLQKKSPKSKAPNRATEDVLAEILELVRGQQKLLSSPEELLPPGYIEFALRQARVLTSDFPDADHPALVDLRRKWEDLMDAVRVSGNDTPGSVATAAEALEEPVEYLMRRVSRQGRRRRAALRARADED